MEMGWEAAGLKSKSEEKGIWKGLGAPASTLRGSLQEMEVGWEEGAPGRS